MAFQVDCIVKGADILGECPLWCEREGVLWWVNSRGPSLKRWDASTKALNYRVKWRADVADSTATEVGLFAERDVVLRDLPSGTNIIVSITARNASGESAPTELGIAVP